MNLRKLGRFTVSRNFIDSDSYWKIFNNIRILEAEYRYDKDAIDYLGVSDWFDIVIPGDIAPEYEFRFDKDNKVECRRTNWLL